MQQRAREPSGGARQPEAEQHAAIHMAPEEPIALQRPDEMRNGNCRDRELGSRLEREQRREQAANAETGHPGDRAGNERHRGDDQVKCHLGSIV